MGFQGPGWGWDLLCQSFDMFRVLGGVGITLLFRSSSRFGDSRLAPCGEQLRYQGLNE